MYARQHSLHCRSDQKESRRHTNDQLHDLQHRQRSQALKPYQVPHRKSDSDSSLSACIFSLSCYTILRISPLFNSLIMIIFNTHKSSSEGPSLPPLSHHLPCGPAARLIIAYAVCFKAVTQRALCSYDSCLILINPACSSHLFVMPVSVPSHLLIRQ